MVTRASKYAWYFPIVRRNQRTGNISSAEALAMFQSWSAGGSAIRLVAVHALEQPRSSLSGEFSRLDEHSATFVSCGRKYFVPLEGAMFEPMTLREIARLVEAGECDQGVRLRWTDSGNYVAVLHSR